MLRFDQFATEAPDVAGPLAARLRAAGVGLLGTVRRDGSPRVSPIEVFFVDGGLWMGMMPDSRKAADVRRDPRVCLLTPVADREDLGGEGKLFGRLRQELDPEVAARVLAAASDVVEVDPAELAGSPVFELEVAAAAWQRVDGDAWRTLSWRADGGVRRRQRVGATGTVEDEP